ncbi:MAG: hypothetical protein MUF54_15265 [Polyangiaceae bacterium]|jgi:hypothetical protein|nr:hypothetical protein [Polyangiaceae bacterium]
MQAGYTGLRDFERICPIRVDWAQICAIFRGMSRRPKSGQVDGATTLHAQIRRSSHDAVRRGFLSQGYRLPAVRPLPPTPGVNRVTKHKTIRALPRARGLTTVKGKGVFVAPDVDLAAGGGGGGAGLGDHFSRGCYSKESVDISAGSLARAVLGALVSSGHSTNAIWPGCGGCNVPDAMRCLPRSNAVFRYGLAARRRRGLHLWVMFGLRIDTEPLFVRARDAA